MIIEYGDDLKRHDGALFFAILVGLALCVVAEKDFFRSAMAYSEKQGVQALNYSDELPDDWPWDVGSLCCDNPNMVANYLKEKGYIWDKERYSYIWKSSEESSEVVFGDSLFSLADGIRQSDEDLRSADKQTGICGVTVKAEFFSSGPQYAMFGSVDNFTHFLNTAVDGLDIGSFAGTSREQVVCGTLRRNGFAFAFAAKYSALSDRQIVDISVVGNSRFTSLVGADALDEGAASRVLEIAKADHGEDE